MRRGGMLPKDHAGHDTLPHDSHQDTMFRGRPAGPGCTPTTPHITAPRMVNRFNAECVWEHLYSLPPEAGGRPGSSAPLAHGPGQDEQDPPSVGLRQQGPLVQGDLSCGGHAEHQPLELRGGRCCRWTYQGNILRPGNPEGHATGLLWHGCHPGQLPAWEHHTVPDKVGCSKSVNSWESDLVWINGDSVISQQRCCGQLHQAALSS